MTLGRKLLMAGQTIASEQTQPPQAAESSSTCRRLLRSLALPAALLLFGVAMQANAAQAKSDGAVGQLKLGNGTGATASGQQGGGAQGDLISLNADGIPPWDFSTDAGENWRFFPPAWQTVPLSSADLTDFELSTTLTIGAYEFKTPPYDTEHYSRFMELPQFHYQGGLVLRENGPLSCYRVQFSVKEKSVALWKTPGNFLAVADCDISQDKPFAVTVRVSGNRFTVSVDGKPVIDVVDRIAPIASGHLLAGANHAAVTVRDVRLATLPPPTGAPTAFAHTPAFAVRDWCGQRWIFDGSEPIARLADGRGGEAWLSHPVALSAVKYRPGTRAADVVSLSFRGAGNWPEKPIEVLSCKQDQVRLRGFTSDREANKEPTVQTVCEVTLTYDADRDSYVYTLENNMTYLAERPAIVEILNPWPYGVCGPAPHAARSWDGRYADILWRDENGGIYRYPLNHFLMPPEPRLYRDSPLFVFAGETDVNPTYEILPPSTGKAYKIGLCVTMLDLHVLRADLPKTLPAGTVQQDRWRIFSSHDGALAALKPLPEPHPCWGVQTNAMAALFDPRSTHFDGDDVVPVYSRQHGQAFAPPAFYTIDPAVGHTGKGALRMDFTHGTHAVRVGEGLSYFGNPFDGTPHVLRLYARTADLDGIFRVSVQLPGNRIVASESLTGTTDGWQLIELRVEPKPGDYAAFINLELNGKRGAKGEVWVDDVSFQPLEAGRQP
jgi:hypothetical protein